MVEKSFDEEQNPTEKSGASENAEPEYLFEGFNIEFSQKIMLTTPVMANLRTQNKGVKA